MLNEDKAANMEKHRRFAMLTPFNGLRNFLEVPSNVLRRTSDI